MSNPATVPIQEDSPSTTLQTISPTLRKKLQQCYEHGTRLMRQEKYDFDYAHSILQECVISDPGNLTYVEAFLQNLQRKYNQNKRGSLLAFGGKGPFRKAVARKDWAEVFKLAPALLRSNPWDVQTLRGLAEACAVIGSHDVELRYLKNALDANPKDPDVNKHCALSLARVGQFDQAIACWDRVDELKRGDLEAQRMISELQIAKTQARRGGGKVEALRRARISDGATATDAPRTTTPEPSARPKIQLTMRQQLEQAIQNNPSDVESYLELAELHANENRIRDAVDVLQRALAASGNNIKVQERMEDIELLQKKQQLAIAEKRAQSDPAGDGQLVRQLRDDLNRMEIEVFDRRAQRYPGNMEYKFQLAIRLKRAGNLREAIEQFEEARRLPDLRTQAALEIGECLQKQKQYDKALKYYSVAAEETAPEKGDVKNLALYRLAVLAEALRHLDEAQRSLEELVSRDPAYKDAATRLDKIRAIRHKQP